MTKTNIISYEQYKRIKATYPHFASFAYWTEDHKGGKADPILAESYEEFKAKGLEGKLHGNFVLLGMNFGVPKNLEDKLGTPLEILETYRQLNYMGNQYGARYMKRILYPSNSMLPSIVGTKLEGAYMTDLFKFDLNEGGTKEWLGCGLPTKESGSLDKRLKKDPELYEHNVIGLYHELYNVLGIKEDPDFVFIGETYSKDILAIEPLRQYFPNSKFYSISHWNRPLSNNLRKLELESLYQAIKE